GSARLSHPSVGEGQRSRQPSGPGGSGGSLVPRQSQGTRWQAKRPARDIGRRTGPPGQARSCFTRLRFREKGKAEVGRSEGGQPVTQEGEGASPAACSRARSLSVCPASLLRQGIRESF